MKRSRALCLLRCVLTLLLAGWVCMLHVFSAQNAETSSALSGGICWELARLTVEGFEELPEPEQEAIVEQLQWPVRKTSHFCEYALGGLLAAALLASFSLSRLRQWLLGGGFGLLNALLDEWHQSFTPGRSPGLSDVLLDLCGFLCGMAVLFFALWLRQKRRKG